MILLIMTIFMYVGIYALIKTDKNPLTDYEKRLVLKQAHLSI